MMNLWHRALTLALAGILLIAQPGPCPCWLYTFWRIEAVNQAVAIDHSSHEGHAGHVVPAPDAQPGSAGGRVDGDSVRFGVNQPPRPAPAAALLAELAEQSIHWRLRCPRSVSVIVWPPAPEPPPPRHA